MTYTTFNPSDKNARITLSGGDLVANISSGVGGFAPVRAALAISAGKFYCEFTITAKNGEITLGIANASASLADGSYIGSDSGGYSYLQTGSTLHSASSAGYGATFTGGDIISMLFDADAGTLVFWKNGVTQGTAFTGITGSWSPAIALQVPVTTITANFGASAFTYAPPAGYYGWGDIPPTPGNAAGTMQAMTAEGARMSAGAGTMQAMTSAGGFNGFGSCTMQAMTNSASGGNNSATLAMNAMTAEASGRSEHRGAVTMAAMTAAATGYDSSINTVEATVPAITLSSSVITGEVITFEGAVPAVTLECGTKDAVLTVPVPTLSATLLSGSIITVEARIAPPILVATLDNPTIITAASTVPAIRLSASLATGNLATAILTLRAPSIAAQILTGNVATVAATVAAPIMEAAGYPAFTITFAGTLPAPRLNATLSAAIASTFRTWVTNLRKGALTEYGPEWAMNSYAVFNGKVLGCTSNGIVELGTQALDNATAINSTVKSGADNFGSSVIKRLPRIYLSHTAAGDARFKLITTEGGSRTYALDHNGVTGIQQRRIPVGRGPKSVRWQWEYTNTDGSDFDIEAVLAYPQALRRRVQ